MTISLNVTLSHNEDDLRLLEQAWHRLQENSDAWSVFNTWQWVTIWWQHYGRPHQLWLLQVYEGDVLVGIAPLMLARVNRLGVLRWRQVQFIGTGIYACHLDIIARHGMKPAVVSAVMSFLYQYRSKWDVCYLENIAEESATAELLRKTKGDWVVDHVDRAPYIRLPERFEDFFAKSVSSAKRTKQRKFMRLLEEHYAGRWSFYRVQRGQDLEPLYAALVKFHQARWEAVGQPGAFGRPGARDFFLDVARRFLDYDWLSLYCLEVDGKPVALLLGFQYQRRTYFYSSGLDYQMHHLNLGHIMQQLIIQDMISRGHTEYDLMSGEEPYKYSWGAEDRLDETLVWYQSRYAQGVEKLYEMVRRTGHALKQLVRRRRMNEQGATDAAS
jgi:CelD/BcsL family acetyltransferase involved in cellulose biosynthesis